MPWHDTQVQNAVWSFETARFLITFEAEPCEDDPADSFEFAEDIEAVRSGAVEWFNAHVIVYHKCDSCDDWHEIARDVLCCCAYRTIEEFHTSHRDPDPMNRNCSIVRTARGDNVAICHYFPDMVSQSIAEARRHLERKAAA